MRDDRAYVWKRVIERLLIRLDRIRIIRRHRSSGLGDRWREPAWRGEREIGHWAYGWQRARRLRLRRRHGRRFNRRDGCRTNR
jgi:hypothetical protein